MVFDEATQAYSCEEYTRNCHLQCPTCGDFVCCRICHDKKKETSSHKFDRFSVETMRCNFCGVVQDVGKDCSSCGKSMGEYYCDICHLFDKNHENSNFVHCDKCGACRKVQKDKKMYHCDECKICVYEPHTHFIIPITESKCGLCGEDISSSRAKAVFPHCGHWHHYECLKTFIYDSIEAGEVPTCKICGEAVITPKKFSEYTEKFMKEHEETE